VNILMFVCDTLRADHLGCYGYFRDTSPNIDRIAKEGVLFEDFYTSGAPTGPAFTCLYTGLHTIRHKFYRFMEANIRQIDDTLPTIPLILRAIGYTTAAIDNLMNFTSHPKHFAKGYEFYINASFNGPARITAEQVNRRLIPWIKHYADEKFFLFVHYWDPHLPYNQPEKYKKMFTHKPGNLSDLEVKNASVGYDYVPGWGKIGDFPEGKKKIGNNTMSIDLYDGEIAYMDHAIGEVIEAIESKNVLDETLVIVTSDHGEDWLGQHYNVWDHASLHDAVTHIPLIMRYPRRLLKETKIKGFCQHIDILPMLIDFIGFPRITEILDIDGMSILPLLKGEEIREQIFMEQTSGLRAVRTKEWKLIEDFKGRFRRKIELYNVKNDSEMEKERAIELKGILQNWIKMNLKEGEKDPLIYEKIPDIRKNQKYRFMMRFISSLTKETEIE